MSVITIRIKLYLQLYTQTLVDLQKITNTPLLYFTLRQDTPTGAVLYTTAMLVPPGSGVMVSLSQCTCLLVVPSDGSRTYIQYTEEVPMQSVVTT